jgi:hypothetical protein
MELPIPATAVIRVSRGNFDPARLPEVTRMAQDTGAYLTPAIRRLPGLIAYFAGVSASGSMVHVSIWESGEHAQQMGRLKEMIVDARQDAERAGVEFIPIVNYPIAWRI